MRAALSTLADAVRGPLPPQRPRPARAHTTSLAPPTSTHRARSVVCARAARRLHRPTPGAGGTAPANVAGHRNPRSRNLRINAPNQIGGLIVIFITSSLTTMRSPPIRSEESPMNQIGESAVAFDRSIAAQSIAVKGGTNGNQSRS